MTHCSLGSVVWKSRRIVGIATLSTVVSRAAMSTADRMITSVIQRRGSGARSSVGVASSTVVVFPSEACIIQVSSEQVKSAVEQADDDGDDGPGGTGPPRDRAG